MEYLTCAKAFFEIPINGRMRAESWMKAGCVALLPSVEVAMVLIQYHQLDLFPLCNCSLGSGGGVSSALEDMLLERAEKKDQHDNVGAVLNNKVSIMLPILRYLQLLCENHNPELQVTPPPELGAKFPGGGGGRFWI